MVYTDEENRGFGHVGVILDGAVSAERKARLEKMLSEPIDLLGRFVLPVGIMRGLYTDFNAWANVPDGSKYEIPRGGREKAIKRSEPICVFVMNSLKGLPDRRLSDFSKTMDADNFDKERSVRFDRGGIINSLKGLGCHSVRKIDRVLEAHMFENDLERWDLQLDLVEYGDIAQFGVYVPYSEIFENPNHKSGLSSRHNTQHLTIFYKFLVDEGYLDLSDTEHCRMIGNVFDERVFYQARRGNADYKSYTPTI